jgi:hypothetical protein
VKGEDWSDGRRNKRWGFFKRFVRHLWGEGLIALPNNIDQYSFKMKAKAIRRYPVETVRACLGKLPARLQCYALLAVNCVGSA